MNVKYNESFTLESSISTQSNADFLVTCKFKSVHAFFYCMLHTFKGKLYGICGIIVE